MPYLVTNKGSIVGPKSNFRHYKPGDRIADDEKNFTPEILARLEGSSRIVRVLKGAVARPLIERAVTVTSKKGMQKGRVVDLAENKEESTGMDGLGPKVGPIQKGFWAENPATLKRVSLKNLNLKVLEKDGGIDPFETKEEAIAWLSQDYVAPLVSV